jgi:hypothetical protein
MDMTEIILNAFKKNNGVSTSEVQEIRVAKLFIVIL